MGGGSSTPPPQIIYRTDPAAAKAAADAAKQTAAQNAAMVKRMEQLDAKNAKNQTQMMNAMNEMAKATAQNNKAELAQMQQAQRQQISEMEQKRQAMETRFRQDMAAASEENRAALEREQEEHRKEQARLEEAARQSRLLELSKQKELIEAALVSVDEEIRDFADRLQREEETLNDIKSFLVIEIAARARFEHVDIEGDVHKLVFLGNTGDGKSTLGNRLTGDTSKRGDRGMFATSGGIESATQVIKTGFTRFQDVPFCVADTPGGGDTDGKDRIHATNLVDFLHGIGAVDAFVLVRNVTNKRLNQGDQEILGVLERLLGAHFWQNVMIVFTRVDDEDAMEEMMDESRVLPNRMGDVFSLPQHVVDGIKVIGIGKRNYGVQAGEIFEAALRCNDGTPFICEDLVAPVEERQGEYDTQQKVVDGARLKLGELKQRLGYLEAKREQVLVFTEELEAGVGQF